MKNKAFVALVITVVLALLLNLAVALLPSRLATVDLSKGQVLEVSEQSRSFLRKLTVPVTLYVIRAGGADASFEEFLERYVESGEQITLQWVELADSASIVEPLGYKTEQLAELQYCVVAKTPYRSEIIDYSRLFYYQVTGTTLSSLGLSVLSVAQYQSYAQYFSSNEQYAGYLSALINETDFCFYGEGVLTRMIEYVCLERIPKNYILTGHQEKAFSDSLLEEICLSGGLQCEMLDLTSVKEIPSDATALVSVMPASDYSEEEISILQRYLSVGGELIVVTGQENLAMPNLMSLMASYGMSAESGAVKEWIADEDSTEGEVSAEGPQLPTEQKWTDDVTVTVNVEHEALYLMEDLSAELTPTVSGGNSILLENRVSLAPLLTTSEKAFIGDATDDRAVRILAAASETPDGARLVWFTGGESFVMNADETSETDNPKIANIYCVYCSLLWSEQGYTSVLDSEKFQPTVYESNYLEATESQATSFAVCTIILTPIALIVCGVVIRIRRKKRVA